MLDELELFLKVLRAEHVRAYGEIGAGDGKRFHEVMLDLPVGSRGVALARPDDEQARGRLPAVVEELRKCGYNTSCLFGYSNTLATVCQFLGRGPFDVLLIDGKRKLPDIVVDWQTYQRAARLIAFSGIMSSDEDNHVSLLWEALQLDGHRIAEFVAPNTNTGIGVVWT